MVGMLMSPWVPGEGALSGVMHGGGGGRRLGAGDGALSGVMHGGGGVGAGSVRARGRFPFGGYAWWRGRGRRLGAGDGALSGVMHGGGGVGAGSLRARGRFPFGGYAWWRGRGRRLAAGEGALSGVMHGGGGVGAGSLRAMGRGRASGAGAGAGVGREARVVARCAAARLMAASCYAAGRFMAAPAVRLMAAPAVRLMAAPAVRLMAAPAVRLMAAPAVRLMAAPRQPTSGGLGAGSAGSRVRLPETLARPTLPASANSRSRPKTAAPRHIRGDPGAGSVRAERPSTGHRCPVLSLMVALCGEYVPRRSADLPPSRPFPRSRRLGNHSCPPDAPEFRASEQGP